MRLFAAVVPPAEVQAAVAEAISSVRREDDGLRWTQPDQWHVTLAFYGKTDEGQVAGLSTRLARAADRHDGMELGLRGAGRFGGRVLWLGVTGSLPLGRLAMTATAAGRREGIEMEERAYRPHVTIARSREPRDLAPLVAALSDWSSSTWEAAAFTLFRSHLGAHPTYEALGTWSLREPG